MRRRAANIFTYVLTGLLLLGSVVFALLRSHQIVISNEGTVLARFEAPEGEHAWRALGARAYDANCQHCHGASGEGWDQYPGVTSSAVFAAAPGGREYMIALHLFGADSDQWRAPMPPMGHMHDVQLAAVVDYTLTQFGNQPLGFAPITPTEISAMRTRHLTAADVARLRPSRR